MDSRRFQAIKELFVRAMAVAPVERPAWIDAQDLDPGLRSALEELLRAQSKETGHLERPAFELAGLEADEPGVEQPDAVGRSIGPFRIEAVLGQGGMGTVYRARQQQPERRVALKVIRGLADPEKIRRQELEAQALALLNHPGIVPLYERGMTDDGAPWFAMEYVEGEPLDRYVEGRSLSRPVLLRLFLELCDAVGHAHSKGILHRDLKPANILVCEPDSDSTRTGRGGSSSSRPGIGSIRVLDFGLARLTGADLTVSTRLTEPGVLLGTLPYMSPEQVRSLEVDQRSDVYALGVILYELITGRKPIDLAGTWVGEAVERVCTEEPLRPSSITRGIDPDLETILFAALAKKPSLRYQSIADLAEDIERFLADRPILAHPPSTLYQLRKLFSRHRGAVSLCLVLFASLLGGGAAFAVLETRHLDRVTAERDLASAAMAFQSRLFQASDSSSARAAAGLRMVTLVDRAAAEVGAAFADLPEVEAEVRNTIGATYLALGRYEQAEPHLRSALDLRRALLGVDHTDTLESRHDLGMLRFDLGDYEGAVEIFEAVLRDRLRVQGATAAETLEERIQICATLLAVGELERAEQEMEEVLALARGRFGPDHAYAFQLEAGLADLLFDRGEFQEAERRLRALLPRVRRVLGEHSPITEDAASFLVSAVFEDGRYAEAERLQRQLYEANRELLGEEHPDTLWDGSFVAEILRVRGDAQGAERLFREILAIQERTIGRQHPSTVYTIERLAIMMAFGPRAEEGLELLREAATLRAAIHGADHEQAVYARYHLGQMLLSLDRLDEGLPLVYESLARYEELRGAAHPDTLFMMQDLGGVLRDHDRLDEAEPLLVRSLELAENALGKGHVKTQRSRYILATILDRQERFEEAHLLYSELVALPPEQHVEQDEFHLRVLADYGANLIEQGLFEEALEPLLESHRAFLELRGPDDPWTRRLTELTIRCRDNL